MSSEWRAGSDDEAEGDEYVPGSASAAAGLRTSAGQRSNGAAAAGGSGDKKRASASSSSVYERVASWAALRESAPVSDAGKVSCAAGSGRSADLAAQPACVSGAVLHPHQMAGLNWIKARFEMGISCILADEMGLGKTLQAISLLGHIYQLAQQPDAPAGASASSSSSSSPSGRVGPFLILCPLSVLDNWARELESYAPALAVQVYTGSKDERQEMRDDIAQCIRALPKAQRRDPLLPFHVLLTTYECALNDSAFLTRFSWRAVIVDEAHRLKNADSALAQTLRLEYQAPWRLFLTGTPVQNDLNELWSLLWGLHPELFDSKKQFVEEFAILAPGTSSSASAGSKAARASLGGAGGPDRAHAHQQALERLHAVVRPLMLRRLKEECALDIPPKREVILRTPLTPLQKSIYKNILLKNSDLLDAAGAGSAAHGQGQGQRVPSARALVNIVQSLRKCATHPYTIAGVEPEPFVEGPHIYECSGKFTVLVKLLRVLKRLGRRVLLFSTSVQSLDVAQDLLTYLGYTYERLDGSVRGEERFQAVANFSRNSGEGASASASGADEPAFVFLLSTRAGGVGLNLTVADTVIFLDSDWNPAQDLQAQARAHRIGQRKRVLVVRLLAAHTLEEIILKRTQRKLLLTHNILEKGKFNHAHGQSGDGGAGGPHADGDDDPEAIGRNAKDLQSILQYGLDSLFANEGGGGGGANAGAGEDASAHEMQEDEIEAIVTGRIEEEQAAAAAAATASAAAAGAAAAESQSATAASAARPSYGRIATSALPSLDDDKYGSASAALDADADVGSVYVYEGTNYKTLAARETQMRDVDVDLDSELADSASKGHKALQRMVAAARASGELDPADGTESDRYGSPSGADRKRKAPPSESEEERAARIARNKELAARRLESAQKKRDQAEADRLASLQQLWDQNGYVSAAVHLDEAEEARFERAAAGAAGGAIDVDESADSSVSEWRAEEEEEEEHKSGQAKASICYVIGDATCPFVFAQGSGSGAVPASASSQSGASAEGEFPSSFDEAAAAAAGDEHPSPDGCSPASALLLVPVDASGSWGKGGVFRALDARSQLIGAQYELIGSMRDLAMGDVHVVTIPADQLRPPTVPYGEEAQPPAPLHVALCVVLRRPKGQSHGAPTLHAESLSLALRKLSSHARAHSFSVHLPRLGAQDPTLGWYAIERMLHKHVVARGVQCYVYRFDRAAPRINHYRSPVKAQLSRANSMLSQTSRPTRTASSFATSSSFSAAIDASAAPSSSAAASWGAAAAAAAPSSSAPAAAAAAARAEPMVLDEGDGAEGGGAAAAQPQSSSLEQFENVFTGCVIYLHRGQAAPDGGSSDSSAHSISDADARLLSRFVSAYDGSVSDSASARVTHLVTAEPFLTPRLVALRRQCAPDARVVPLAWLHQCVAAGRLDSDPALQVGERK